MAMSVDMLLYKDNMKEMTPVLTSVLLLTLQLISYAPKMFSVFTGS